MVVVVVNTYESFCISFFMCAFVVYVLLLCLFAWFVCGCLFVLVGAKRFVCLAPPKHLGYFWRDRVRDRAVV